MISELINVVGLIPIFDFGKLRVLIDEVKLEFFKPMVGKQHWSEDNYLNNPFQYKIKCKVSVYNGKKKVSGINNCSFELKYKNPLITGEIEGDLYSLMNIPSGERREVTFSQEGMLFYGENLKEGYSLFFKYYKNGKKKESKIIVKHV